MNPADHDKILDALEAAHEKRLLETLQDLEDKIAVYLAGAPLEAGQLFDTAWAIQARTAINQAVTETLLTSADEMIREYDKIVASLGAMYPDIEAFTSIPPQVISNLKRVAFSGFEDIASVFVNELANELYQNTIAGRPMAESVRNMRQKINGIYMNSDSEEINRLVTIAKDGGKDADAAVEKLHKVYAADRAGRNMRRYASQMVRDSLSQFNASLTMQSSREGGIEKWMYYGSVVNDSRDFCIRHAGKTYTEKEIRKIWKGSWTGKAAGDPFIVRGGYNCRHFWVAVQDD